jgi:hypothetical protein
MRRQSFSERPRDTGLADKDGAALRRSEDLSVARPRQLARQELLVHYDVNTRRLLDNKQLR